MKTIKTIKIIDLLNKIANGEEIPEKIKYNNTIFVYENCTYNNEKYDYIDLRHYLCINWNYYTLTEEVEIIEEEKKIPEKLKDVYINNETMCDAEIYLRHDENAIAHKINEIIDYLESKEKENKNE